METTFYSVSDVGMKCSLNCILYYAPVEMTGTVFPQFLMQSEIVQVFDISLKFES